MCVVQYSTLHTLHYNHGAQFQLLPERGWGISPPSEIDNIWWGWYLPGAGHDRSPSPPFSSTGRQIVGIKKILCLSWKARQVLYISIHAILDQMSKHVYLYFSQLFLFRFFVSKWFSETSNVFIWFIVKQKPVLGIFNIYSVHQFLKISFHVPTHFIQNEMLKRFTVWSVNIPSSESWPIFTVTGSCDIVKIVIAQLSSGMPVPVFWVSRSSHCSVCIPDLYSPGLPF